MWEVFETDEEVQIIPVDDVMKHKRAGVHCKCKPRIEIDNDSRMPTVIHNAFDGRDLVENGVADEKKVIFE